MKKKIKNKAEEGRIKRHYRIRKAIIGTKVRPRFSVHRSHLNLYVQFIDDENNRTLLYCSTTDKGFKETCHKGGNIESAKKFGRYVSQEANKKGIKEVVFDRGGYLYHGRIKALADSARAGGLKF